METVLCLTVYRATRIAAVCDRRVAEDETETSNAQINTLVLSGSTSLEQSQH